MITVVITGYAVLMLTIVFALAKAASRTTPKRSNIVLEDTAVRRFSKPAFAPTLPKTNHGGGEIWAFEA